MNCAFFSPDGLPSKKNPNLGIFTLEQAQACKEINNFTPYLFDLKSNNKKTITCDIFDGIKIYRLFNTKYNIIKLLKNYIFIFKTLSAIKPIFILCSFLNLRNVFYTFCIKYKIITIVHGTDANCKNFFKKIFFRSFLNKTFKVFTVSKYTKKILLKNFTYPFIKKKVFVVHNGFSREKLRNINKIFYNKNYKNKILLLSIANLVPRKNISDLIKIFAELDRKFKNKLHLNIVGDGSEKKNIKELIKKYNLNGHITLHSRLNNNEIAALYKMSKFFFLFSKNYKEQFEGFGIVFLEAMYKKNIVFASKHGGITDIVKNNFNGFLFDVNNTNYKKKVISSFSLILKDNITQKRIIKNAYNFSRNFSWKKNISQILSRTL